MQEPTANTIRVHVKNKSLECVCKTLDEFKRRARTKVRWLPPFNQSTSTKQPFLSREPSRGESTLDHLMNVC